MPLKAALFDLDGVIVKTDIFHYKSWKRLSREEGVPFDENVNRRLRGISRMEGLDIFLEKAERKYSRDEKIKLAARKNSYYLGMIEEELTEKDFFSGVLELISALKRENILVALCSGSKNARTVLAKLKLNELFDTVVDGHDMTKTKPDPEIFLMAAERLGIVPEECLVFEDAEAGIEAAHGAGMKAVGIGNTSHLAKAELTISEFDEINPEKLKGLF